MLSETRTADSRTETTARCANHRKVRTPCGGFHLRVTEASRLLGLARPDVSRLLRDVFRECSPERLFRLLTRLGRDIDIVIRQPRSATGGRLAVSESA